MGNWWAGEFANGTPQWKSALTFKVGDSTITEVPFTTGDGLTMLNVPTGVEPLPFLALNRPMSKLYLLIYSRPGLANVSEYMSIVVKMDYMNMLDSLARSFPDLHINNVFPGPMKLGDFRGSYKFFNIKGFQILEEKFGDGNLIEYTPYDAVPSNFAMNPWPQVFPMSYAVTMCWETVYYTTVCGTGEYANICYSTITGISHNCLSWQEPGGGGVPPPPTGWGGGGSSNPPGPPINRIASPKGLSCLSFNFQPGPGNWQEAGLKDYKYKIGLLDPVTYKVIYRVVTFPQAMYFGLPKVYGGGVPLSAGEAGVKAAKAVDDAGFYTADYFKNSFTGVSDYTIQVKYKEYLIRELRIVGGTLAVNPTIPNCIVSTPIFYTWYPDNCN